MSSPKREDVATADHVDLPPRSKGAKGHCRRFWWVYLLILVVIVVVVIPVIILVAVPKIVQQKIDAATLNVDGIVVTSPTSSTLNMAINSTISADSSVKATIDSFVGTMYLMDVDPPLEIATLNFPQVATASQIIVNISQVIPVTDAITTFNTHVFTQQSVTVGLVGYPNVYVSGISRAYPVTFSKTITLAGINGFAGLSASNISVSAASTANFNSTAIIPNASIFTFEAGNITFNTYFNDTNIGPSFMNDVTLVPGNNSFFLTANINNNDVLPALSSGPYCKTGVLPISLSGSAVSFNGVSLPYYAIPLGSENTTVDLPIGAAVKSDLGITLGC